MMITIAIRKVLEGHLSARLGRGRNSFVYVDNCAWAHILAFKSLQRSSAADGEAFFLSDYAANSFDHLVPFVEAAGGEIPESVAPVWVGLALARVSEVGEQFARAG